MTLLQSVQTGRRRPMNVLENYFIQLFQHNTMAVNKQTRSTTTSHMHLEPLHTLHSLPSTKATDQSLIFFLTAHTTIENRGR